MPIQVYRIGPGEIWINQYFPGLYLPLVWPDIPWGTGEDLTSSDRPWGRGEGRVRGHGGSPAQGGGEGGRDVRGGYGSGEGLS